MNLHKLVRWRPTRGQVLRAGGIVIALAALVVLIRLGYAHPWTGFGQSEVNQEVQPAKTLWDWLDLLIVPVVLAIGGYLFNSSQNRASQKAAERRAQDDALQDYLDHMSDMLIPKKDQPSLYENRPDEDTDDNLSTVARARTLTVLSRLNGDRKARVVFFLYEARLIYRDGRVFLGNADLREAALDRVFMPTVWLAKADLSGADLSGAWLGKADLRFADLRGTDLSEADLSGANLINAKVTEEQLEQAESLEDATMPDGQKYEGWLKSKGRGEE